MGNPNQSGQPVRVGLISLGCAKNLVDAEIMLGTLAQQGLAITNDPQDADVVIVNTCSFIDAAQEESVDTILESSKLREQARPGQGLVVAGCLPQRFPKELPQLLPEVDAFMGVDEVARVGEIVQQALRRRQALNAAQPPTDRAASRRGKRQPEAKASRKRAASRRGDKGGKPGPAAVEAKGPAPHVDPASVNIHLRPKYVPDYATPRFRLTPRHFAYLKIAEGCNHPCSFCTIPRMRGTYRSRSIQDLLEDARRLIDDGVRELDLISQDSTYYGLDLRPKREGSISAPAKFAAASRSLPTEAASLSRLLRELDRLPGDFWVRLLYTHPAHWTDELIATMAECRKVARYVDIPLQHIHPVMLERMRRETSRDFIVDLLRRIRTGVPGITLRTTFIVGFPGETEACFQSLLDFIRETRFDRLGVFTYSREDGTRAAAMGGHVSEETKKRRRDEAMSVQRDIARSLSASRVGTRLKVLVEREVTREQAGSANLSSWEHGLIRAANSPALARLGRVFVARSEGDAPDIDGRVYVNGKLAVGEFATVKVVGHTDYDLLARPSEAVPARSRMESRA